MGIFMFNMHTALKKKMHYLKKTCTCILNLYYLPIYLKKYIFLYRKEE